jgi:site-specific DNA-cytosine methylase
MNKNINVLSLFDGIATGMLSLKELGYTPNYYASEIEKGAISIALHNHPEIVEIGDVTKISFKNGMLWTKEIINDKETDLIISKVDHIDLLIGGSPCNQLSNQNKNRNGLKGKESSLFYEFFRLKEEINPKYFLLENVKMNKHDQNEITKLLGVEPIRINSSLVSAQLRDRLYWTNIPNVIQPKDKNIMLQDIIENGYVDREKSNCITESSSRQAATPGGLRRYTMGFGQCVFVSKEEYERIIGKTDEERVEYAKKMRALPNSKGLVEHIDTPKIRKITPREAEILQTLPIDYTNIKSIYYSSKGYNQNRGDSKRVSVIGEGWTKDVIVHIMKNMEF